MDKIVKKNSDVSTPPAQQNNKTLDKILEARYLELFGEDYLKEDQLILNKYDHQPKQIQKPIKLGKEKKGFKQ